MPDVKIMKRPPRKNEGRPTKYKESYPQDLIDYFSVPPIYQRTVIRYSKNGDETETEVDVMNDFPTLAGWCAKLGVYRDIIYGWAEKHEEFSHAIKKAKELQENFLVTVAMKGLSNPAFSIFAAKNLINWRDKQEMDLTSGGEKMQGVVILPALSE